MTDERETVLAKMAEDMLYMGQVLFPDRAKVPFAPVHREMRDMLQDVSLRYLNFILPRGHAKSSLVNVFFPVWHIFLEDLYLGRERERKFVVLTSRTQDLAKDQLRDIKRMLMTSRPFQYLFGDWSTFLIDREDRLELKDETMVLCKGMGQQFVGLNHKGQRPTLALCDDLEDKSNTLTDEALDKNFRWLVGDVEPATDPRTGRVVIVGTPKHRNCIVERLDREKSGYASLRRGAILHENTPEERALWEAWKPLKDLKKDRRRARARGEEGEWVQEMLCRVTSEDSTFSNIKYWEGDVERDAQGNVYLIVRMLGGRETKGELDLMDTLDEPLVVPVNCFQGTDPAISAARRADAFAHLVRGYTESALGYVPEGPKHFTIDLTKRKGVTVEDQAQIIVRKGKLYKAMYTAVETTAYQEALRQRVEELMGEEGVFLNGVGSKHNPKKKKKGDNSRLSEMQPDFALGRVYLRASHVALRDEALDYPHGEDNCLDALYYSRVQSFPPLHTPAMLRGGEKKAMSPYQEYLASLAATSPRTDWQVN